MHSDKFPTGQTPEEFDESSTPAGEPADTDATSGTVLNSPYGPATGVTRTSILAAAHSAATASTPAEAAPVAGTPEAVEVAAEPIRLAASANAGSAEHFEVVTSPDTAAAAKPSRRRRWAMSAVAATILLVGVGGYAYAQHYSDVAVPGTTVAGTDVSGMSRDAIISTIESRAQAATVTVTGDADATVSLSELGTTIDAAATADAAMNRGSAVLDRFKALLSGADITVVTSNDEAVLKDYAGTLVPDDQAKARNASVVLNADSTAFEITSSSEGLSVDTTDLALAAAQAAQSLSPASVEVSYVNTPPAVSDDDAKTVAETANEWISQDVTITNTDGTDSYTADAATKASWIIITENLDAAPTLSIDSDAVAHWVGTQANAANVTPVVGQRNVNSSGQVVATSVEAVAGQKVNNTETITAAISTALSSGQAYSGSFEMTTDEEQWEERKIADGAENLAYQAADGEKWVDINLSTKTVTAYEGATVVRGPVSVVDGAAATPTVTGTYHVYLQYEIQTMRGQNADGSNYETENVPWISYFYEGYALHGAPWWSSWGFSASHGCLNMPVDEAKWIYDWVEIGTTVVS
ncbi:L,D-transpeptidase, partial [Actinomyces qiguomingii]